MKRAYVDASVLVGLHFREPEARGLAKSLKAHAQLLSASLVVAEVLAALRRENRDLSEADALLARIDLFAPDGSLRAECEETIRMARLRGADLWHLACAISIAGKRQRRALTFMTLDADQSIAARSLGFTTVP